MSLKFVPEWLTYEVNDALAAIESPQVAKKEATVLHMAQAIALGESQGSVFARHDTCSKNIWHGVNGKVGWKDDPAIATALAMATQRARWWVRVKQGRAVQNTLEILVDAGEQAAQQMVNMVRMGVQVFDFGLDGVELRRVGTGEVLEASKQILDRISIATAGKSQTNIGLNADQFAALTIQAKAEAAQIEAAAAEVWPSDAD